MLTLLATPKAFDGLFAVIQRNAITSWTHLSPRPEIILFGDDKGTSELCEELGLRHVPDVALSDRGTPLLNDIFERGQEMATNDAVCFLNADIILLDDVIDAVTALAPLGDYLAVGRRRDLTITEVMDFAPGWSARLRQEALAEGELMPPIWVDYFIFPRGTVVDVPPFAIGRPGYDNWLLWAAATRGAKVIDATAAVTVVHQRHDYSHVGGKSVAYRGAEAEQNKQLIGDWRHLHSILHCPWVLTASLDVAPARDLQHRTARLRSRVSHLVRFTRPLRQQLHERRALRSLQKTGRSET